MLCLITGSNGLLGQKIFQELTNHDYTVVLTSLGENKISNLKGYNYESLDISDEGKVSEVLKEYEPNVVFNRKKVYGVMHISGDEMMSIFEMVERLVKFYKFDVSLIE